MRNDMQQMYYIGLIVYRATGFTYFSYGRRLFIKKLHLNAWLFFLATPCIYADEFGIVEGRPFIKDKELQLSFSNLRLTYFTVILHETP